jgi:CubicO group peptidase (beta-lactamase class C family)
MKKNFLLLGFFVVVLFSLRGPALRSSQTSAAEPAAASPAPQKGANEAGQNARIQRIENGLMSGAQIRGQAPKRMTIRDRMQFYKVPGVSVAFFEQGKISWARGYGYADLATKRPVTPETLFQAASISKPVASLAVLRLVQDGKLSLDEDVNVKLTSWKVPENEFTAEQKVTLRRILSHSAGTTVHGFAGYASDEAVPTVAQVLNGEKPANSEPVRVDVVPGTIFRYSGGGMTIMQLLLTDVTGKPFPQIVEELVLRPAEMNHSGYTQPLPKNLWANAATPYRDNGDPVKGGAHTYPELAAAGLWTTPSDLGRMAIEVKKEYDGVSSKILTKDMARQMLTHQKDEYGLGFGLESPGKALHFGHGGANEGFRCVFTEFTESGQGVAIMTNSDSGGSLIQEVLLSVAQEYGWPEPVPTEHTLGKVDAAALPSYAGTYEGTDIGKLVFTAKDGRLLVQAEFLGSEARELYPESNSKFFLLSQDITFSFGRDEKGSVANVVIQAGRAFTAKKLP